MYEETISLTDDRETIEIEYPRGKDCLDKIHCVLILRTSPKFHLVISTKHFKVLGFNSSDCVYAGLALYPSRSKSKNKELPTRCISQDGSYKYSDVISHSNTFTLVFYQHVLYRELKVTLEISLTKCALVLIHPCRDKEVTVDLHSTQKDCVILQILNDYSKPKFYSSTCDVSIAPIFFKPINTKMIIDIIVDGFFRGKLV